VPSKMSPRSLRFARRSNAISELVMSSLGRRLRC
jgi:hypothetical protein